MPFIGNNKQRQPNFRELPLESCKGMILKHHYSQRLPVSVQLCYGDISYTPRLVHSCCIFSTPNGRWQEDCWELTRLVRLPNYDIPLTKLVGKAVGYIRSKRYIDLLISFADLEEDHHGGIYQACSWVYDGMRDSRLDGFNIEGEFWTARKCNHVFGTSSETELQDRPELQGKAVEPHYDQGKHLYWKALTKQGMQRAIRLGLNSLHYPKPMLRDTLDIPLEGGKSDTPLNALGANLQAPSEGLHRKGKIKLPGLKRAYTQPTERLDLEGDSLL